MSHKLVDIILLSGICTMWLMITYTATMKVITFHVFICLSIKIIFDIQIALFLTIVKVQI